MHRIARPIENPARNAIKSCVKAVIIRHCIFGLVKYTVRTAMILYTPSKTVRMQCYRHICITIGKSKLNNEKKNHPDRFIPRVFSDAVFAVSTATL